MDGIATAATVLGLLLLPGAILLSVDAAGGRYGRGWQALVGAACVVLLGAGVSRATQTFDLKVFLGALAVVAGCAWVFRSGTERYTRSGWATVLGMSVCAALWSSIYWASRPVSDPASPPSTALPESVRMRA